MAGSSNTTPTLVVLSLITIIVILIVNIQTARDINDDLEFNLEKSQEKIVSEQVMWFKYILNIKWNFSIC